MQFNVRLTLAGKCKTALSGLTLTVYFLGPLSPARCALSQSPPFCDVRQYGAAGDGLNLDTSAINKAIEACGSAGGGQVLLPPGRYLSGTIHLRSHVTLFLAAGATLVGTTNLAEYQPPGAPSFMPQARYGNWNRGLIVAENAEDMTICG